MWQHFFSFQFHALVFCSTVVDPFVKDCVWGRWGGGANSPERQLGGEQVFHTPDIVFGCGLSCWPIYPVTLNQSPCLQNKRDPVAVLLRRCNGVYDHGRPC